MLWKANVKSVWHDKCTSSSTDFKHSWIIPTDSFYCEEENEKDIFQRRPGSDRINRKRNNDFINKLKSKILKDPTKSTRKLATELKVDAKAIRTAVKDDLKLKSYTRTPRHLLTWSMKARRLERCKKILIYLKRNKSTMKIFSDEKTFTVDTILNRRNDRCIAHSKAHVNGTFRTKHSA